VEEQLEPSLQHLPDREPAALQEKVENKQLNYMIMVP